MKKQLSIFISLMVSLTIIFQVNLNSVLASQIQIEDLSCVFKTYKTATLNWTKPKNEWGDEVKNLSVKVQQSINDQEWKNSTLCDSKKELSLINTLSDIGALTVIGLNENTMYKFRLVILDGTDTAYSNEISVVTTSKNDNNNKVVELPNDDFHQSVNQVLNKVNQKLEISDVNELRYLSILPSNIKNTIEVQYFQSLEHLNNFKAGLKDDAVNLTWINPKSQSFSKAIIVRKQGSYPVNQNDGIKVYEGKGELYADKDSDLMPGITYYYRAFLYDTSGNLSIGIIGNEVNVKYFKKAILSIYPYDDKQTHVYDYTSTEISDKDFLNLLLLNKGILTVPTLKSSYSYTFDINRLITYFKDNKFDGYCFILLAKNFRCENWQDGAPELALWYCADINPVKLVAKPYSYRTGLYVNDSPDEHYPALPPDKYLPLDKCPNYAYACGDLPYTVYYFKINSK